MLLLPEDLGTWPTLCRAAEDAGFGFLGVGDSQSIFRDVYVALTLAAQATLLAFVDNFRLITVLAICCIPLAVFLRRARARPAPGAH